ncbi:MAG TPA: hypothetical protein VGA75_07770 [Paracoccaceae bacterium]
MSADRRRTVWPARLYPGDVLVIEAMEALALIAELPRRPVVTLARFAELDHDLLARFQPDCVVFPLFAQRLDATRVVRRLSELGYRGNVCALAPPLPDGAMVEAELRAVAPDLNLHLIDIPH